MKYISILLLMGLLYGCCTVRNGYNDAERQAQKQLVELETRIKQVDTTIERHLRELESVRERAATLEGTVDGIIELFDQYDRAVRQLIQDYRMLKEETKLLEKSNNN